MFGNTVEEITFSGNGADRADHRIRGEVMAFLETIGETGQNQHKTAKCRDKPAAEVVQVIETGLDFAFRCAEEALLQFRRRTSRDPFP